MMAPYTRGKLESFFQSPRGRRGGFDGVHYTTQNTKYWPVLATHHFLAISAINCSYFYERLI